MGFLEIDKEDKFKALASGKASSEYYNEIEQEDNITEKVINPNKYKNKINNDFLNPFQNSKGRYLENTYQAKCSELERKRQNQFLENYNNQTGKKLNNGVIFNELSELEKAFNDFAEKMGLDSSRRKKVNRNLLETKLDINSDKNSFLVEDNSPIISNEEDIEDNNNKFSYSTINKRKSEFNLDKNKIKKHFSLKKDVKKRFHYGNKIKNKYGLSASLNNSLSNFDLNSYDDKDVNNDEFNNKNDFVQKFLAIENNLLKGIHKNNIKITEDLLLEDNKTLFFTINKIEDLNHNQILEILSNLKCGNYSDDKNLDSFNDYRLKEIFLENREFSHELILIYFDKKKMLNNDDKTVDEIELTNIEEINENNIKQESIKNSINKKEDISKLKNEKYLNQKKEKPLDKSKYLKGLVYLNKDIHYKRWLSGYQRFSKNKEITHKRYNDLKKLRKEIKVFYKGLEDKDLIEILNSQILSKNILNDINEMNNFFGILLTKKPKNFSDILPILSSNPEILEKEIESLKSK